MAARPLATIGYELATVPNFLEALREAEVDVVADVRAIANSRRPGFAKSRISASLEGAGIGYVHLRGLGTPADGRVAAKAGRHEEMHRIYRKHLETAEAQADLEALIELVRGGTRVCLLCLEANAEHCHRSIVAAAVGQAVPVKVTHLHPEE